MSGGQDSGDVSDFTGLSVAVGRIEEGIKSLNATATTLVTQSNEHGSTLARHEVEIQLLKSKQPRRAPWWTLVGVAVGILAAAAAVVEAIALLHP